MGFEWLLNYDQYIDRAERKKKHHEFMCQLKEGITFISSKKDSEEPHTGEYIFENVDKYIEEVGPQNVIELVMARQWF